jgi:hypothetical protein
MRIVKSEFEAPYELSEIHDGYLGGVDISDEKELKLTMKTVVGDSFRLTVKGLVALKADNFRQGNIIEGIYFFTADTCPEDYLCLAYDFVSNIDREKYLPIELKKLTPYPWTLIEVSSSYGCDLYAVSSNSISDFIIDRI